MILLKFKTMGGATLYVPEDHLVSIYGTPDKEPTTITLTNRMTYDITGTPEYIANGILNNKVDPE